ncbi:MAG: glycosyltransferase family 39 protein [candidate division WOR-3 bacterium]
MRVPRGLFRKPGFWFVVYIVFWLTANLITLTWFPGWDLNQDEALHASCAWGIWEYGAVRSGFLPGSYLGQYGYGMLSSWIYYGILALFLKIFGIGIFWARLPSLLSGAAILLCTYQMGREFGSPASGLLASVFTGFEVFFLRASHYTRSDAMLAAWICVSVLLFLVAMRRKAWWIFATLGFVSGISVLVRPLGIFLVPGLAMLMILSRRWAGLAWFSLGAALAGFIMLFTNFLPFRDYPILSDIDEPNRSSPLFLLLTRQFHLIPIVIESKTRFLLLIFLGWHEPISRFLILRVILLAATLGAMLRFRDYPLLYGIPLALTLSAIFCWPLLRGGYLIFLVPLLALGFFVAFQRVSWIRWGMLMFGVVVGSVAAYRSTEECRANAPIRRLESMVFREIPPGKTLMINWFWFWWPLHHRNRLVAMVDHDFTWGDLSFADLVKRHDPDYIAVVFWKDFLIWPRQMNHGDTLYISGLEKMAGFYFQGENRWRGFDSLIIYKVPDGL